MAGVSGVGASSISNLSSTSSRSEHMAYLMNDLSLDRPTAMLMYRAERLQEKGQIRQALRYLEQVLSVKPDCEEATVNARMIRAELAGQDAQHLPAVSEHSTMRQPSGAQPLQTADLEITFTCRDKEQRDAYWDEASLNEVALRKARKLLQEHNINTPFVTLVRNDIMRSTPSVDIDPWMDTVHDCHAVVRVTFPPTGQASGGGEHSNLADFRDLLGSQRYNITSAQRSNMSPSEPGAEPGVSSTRGASGSGMLCVDSCAAAAASDVDDMRSRSEGSSHWFSASQGSGSQGVHGY
eukprot:TRINITY_DN11566_c0_g2_i1.p1 TRINITY_DN11566_c0_g2~~TRINITY_DN11566_c0_g2_i1.p1  ORF type:complete len:323 (+),score=51.88 TRINITY_DN11566_c0_g2_i1:87-971(+)